MKIALVEDDINMRKSLEIAISDYKEFEVVSFKNAKDALLKLDNSIDLIVTDINMPGMDGIEFVKELDGKFEVIIMTGNATLQRAIEAIQLGVKDFLVKPFEIDTLVDAIKRSEKVQQVVKSKPTVSKKSKNGFIGESDAIKRVKSMAERAAKTDATVLLLGESGVGKEVFARFVHEQSPRSSKAFTAINMAAIPENLIESELFGFVKGAFTDAHADKAGKFEAANGGTIFLDEIGEMPYHLQAKLLRVLQEREVVRLGSQKPVKVDVRVISATNANLGDKITQGLFREDLYYRLNTIPVSIPPLRERQDEILSIANATLEDAIKRYDLEAKQLSDEAEAALLSYKWPGNIRELLSVVERAAILSDTADISSEDLFLESRSKKSTIENMEKDLILEVLENCEEDLDKSAVMLGMSEQVLKTKMKKYEIGARS
ncbi:MAG: sigma-54 dependent transcriptional regulator [Thiovulaceae bacterium]|nr:sigma-54 dependent transcriptional regulator [Sulfurimonadaceae bacterium]